VPPGLSWWHLPTGFRRPALCAPLPCTPGCCLVRRSKRQKYFSGTAFALLCLQTCYCICYVVAFSLTIAKPNCGYPWKALPVTDFLQVWRHLTLACAGGGQAGRGWDGLEWA